MTEETPKNEICVEDCNAGEMRRGVRDFANEYFLIVKNVNPVTRDYLYAIGLESGIWIENPDFTVER